MKTILVVNQKGGVGKSMISDELAFSFERSGISVAFYDLDNQGGTIHKTNDNENADVGIVDTPGALQARLPEWIKNADVIVVPTRTSSRDIPPLRTIRDAIIKHGSRTCKVVYVFNGYASRFKASQDFEDFFKILAGENQTICRIPQSEQVVQAGAYKVSVVTYAPHSTVAKAIQEMDNAIRMAAGFKSEA